MNPQSDMPWPPEALGFIFVVVLIVYALIRAFRK
jgi:hypothetical protein